MHLIRINPRSYSCCNVITHSFSRGLTTHSILVINYVDNYWQTSCHVTFPQFSELIHCGKGDSFPHRTTSHSCITNVGNYQARFAIYFLVQSSTNSYITRATHNSIIRVNSKRCEKGMHRASQSFIKTCFACKYFSQCSVY